MKYTYMKISLSHFLVLMTNLHDTHNWIIQCIRKFEQATCMFSSSISSSREKFDSVFVQISMQIPIINRNLKYTEIITYNSLISLCDLILKKSGLFCSWWSKILDTNMPNDISRFLQLFMILIDGFLFHQICIQKMFDSKSLIWIMLNIIKKKKKCSIISTYIIPTNYISSIFMERDHFHEKMKNIK